MLKRLTCRILALVLSLCLLSGTTCIYAATDLPAPMDLTSISGRPEPPQVAAEATILMEAKTGAILYAKNAHTTYYPASITKVMTALLTLENCSLDEVVTFSYRATHELEEGSSSIARTEGEELSVKNCLYALMIASANEVAQALAEHVSGSLEDFAALMTERAKEIGCLNTNFSNPSGLNDPNHYTSAYDMALIMREAVQNPAFVEIDSTTSYYIPATNKNPEKLGIAMKHKLLQKGDSHYEYAVAGKTGYTSLAGYTLVTYAVKGDMELICVTLGCDTSDDRYTTTRALFEYGFNNYTMYNVAEHDTSFNTNNELLEDDSFLGSSLISLSIPDNNWIILPNSVPFSALESNFAWGDSEAAANTLATVTYSYNGLPVGQANLTVLQDEDNFQFQATNEAGSLESREGTEEISANDKTLSAEDETEDEEKKEDEGGISWWKILIGILLAAILLFLLWYFFRRDRRRRRRRVRSYRHTMTGRRGRGRRKIKMRL